MTIRLADSYGPVLKGRIMAAGLREEIEREAKNRPSIVIDMTGVEAVSPSFADELFARLPAAIRAEVRFEHLSPHLELVARMATHTRTRPQNAVEADIRAAIGDLAHVADIYAEGANVFRQSVPLFADALAGLEHDPVDASPEVARSLSELAAGVAAGQAQIEEGGYAVIEGADALTELVPDGAGHHLPELARAAANVAATAERLRIELASIARELEALRGYSPEVDQAVDRFLDGLEQASQFYLTMQDKAHAVAARSSPASR